MKTILTTSIVSLAFFTLKAQNFPYNAQTGLISVRDSFNTNLLAENSIKKLILDWNTFISQPGEANKVLDYDGIRKNAILTMNSYAYKSSINKTTTQCYLNFFSFKKVLGNLVPDAPYQILRFNFITYLRNQFFIYEFTDIEAVVEENSQVVEKFENEKITNRTFLANDKKKWSEFKSSAIDKIYILSKSLKGFVTSNLVAENSTLNPDLINYTNYEKIQFDMTYGEVTNILGKGKELSSTKTNKTVEWKSQINNKSIVITFQNDKVSNKTQSNL